MLNINYAKRYLMNMCTSTHADLKFPRFIQRYEKTETKDSDGHHISYEPTKNCLFITHKYKIALIQSDTCRMRSHRAHVYSEERDCNKCTVASEAKH